MIDSVEQISYPCSYVFRARLYLSLPQDKVIQNFCSDKKWRPFSKNLTGYFDTEWHSTMSEEDAMSI